MKIEIVSTNKLKQATLYIKEIEKTKAKIVDEKYENFIILDLENERFFCSYEKMISFILCFAKTLCVPLLPCPASNTCQKNIYLDYFLYSKKALEKVAEPNYFLISIHFAEG